MTGTAIAITVKFPQNALTKASHNTFLAAVINSKFDFALNGLPMPSRGKIRPDGKGLSTTKKDAPGGAG